MAAAPQFYGTNQRPPRSSTANQMRLSSELDLDSAGGSSNGSHYAGASSSNNSHYTPLTTPIVIETNMLGQVQTGSNLSNSAADVGPICASSPKRSMSAFTTFGPGSRSNVTTPMSPPPLEGPLSRGPHDLPPRGPGGPATGHLVWNWSFLLYKNDIVLVLCFYDMKIQHKYPHHTLKKPDL